MPNHPLSEKHILKPSGLDHQDLDTALNKIVSNNIDHADLYFQYSKNEFWSLEDSDVKNGSFSIEQGVGIRSIAGEKTAFTYSDEISMDVLESGAKIVKTISSNNKNVSFKNENLVNKHNLYRPINPIDSIESANKIALLERVESIAKKLNPYIVKVSASLASQFEVVLIKTFNGDLVEDVRPLVRLSLSVIVDKDQRREQGSAGGGGRYPLDYFTDQILHQYATDAVNQAIINLDAKPAPAGLMTVVLGSGWPGILLHEAIGHGLEGDFNRKGTSAFSGKIGTKVASSEVTVVDDGTIPNRRGSLNVDDEGNATTRTTLIEKGRLVGYMQDTMNANLMNTATTGNGRRESYAHLPMPRMTNTFMLNGKYEPDEIIKSVDDGIYADNFGGGQVDITSGKFVFSASQAWVIKNGKLIHPIKGASIVGNGPQILNEVSMVGNDMKLDTGVGTCGKDGQSVPVGVGQPTLKIDNIIVGGTN